jgi:azurin
MISHGSINAPFMNFEILPPTMKKRLPLSLVFACAIFVVGQSSATAQDKPAAKPPKPAKIQISIVPGALRFATTRFDVTAGSPLELTLKNTCIMPHNLVLGRPGKADDLFQQAMALADRGMALNFIPETPDVIAAFKIVNPGQADTIKLDAPSEPGEYPYLCTYPGHGTVMRGVMRVKPAGEKLEEAVVEKISGPKLVDALKSSEATSKPMGSRERPFVMRSFVPNPKLGDEVLTHHDRGLTAQGYSPSTGQDIEGKEVKAIPGLPCGIAVSFGPDFAYVWDSTECRLLYAWTGGFLDMTPYWGGGTGGGRRSSDYVPWLEGTLVFKAAGGDPFQLGDPTKRAKFRGYRVLSGNPEFTYERAGVTIHEHITPADPGSFMVHYRVENAREPVRLVFDPAIRPQISCDQGGWKENTLEIPVDHADHFMLLVRFQPGEIYKVDPAKLKSGKTSEEP